MVVYRIEKNVDKLDSRNPWDFNLLRLSPELLID